VGETRAALEQTAPMTVYEPYWEIGLRGPSFLVRTRADPAAVMGSMRAVLRSMDAELPLAQTRTMAQILDESVAVRRMQLYLAAAFAAAALALASLGIYGVISFAVARRTPELGIRIALGARTGQLMAMVLGQGMRPVAVGLAAGIAGALAIGGLLSSQLYGVRPNDPATIAGVAVMLLGVAACACWIPARRAARIDPLRALRFE
jgi:ABC-type antimicrobial peptide transport system permease subunit